MQSRSRGHRAAYRRDGDAWLIEIRLREVRQLFHHLDPAPFREQDLDPDAEQYLEEALREIGPAQRLRLVVHLPAQEAATPDAQNLPAAVAHFFRYRADRVRAELRRLLANGAISLLIGLVFLAVCLSLRTSLAARGSSAILTEGLLILGWVGLWRPIEIFLYDWWPIRRRQRRFEALARAPLTIATVAS